MMTVLSIFSLRMLGLFMVLPVLALYAASLPGGTPFAVGLAVGAHGISQALLQIPYGWASDRYGRRLVVVGGLIVFAAGSFIAAISDTITGVILGRVLQGAGAISAVLTAVVGDHISEQRRTRAMAFVGIGIGLSFVLSLLLGPILSSRVGVKGLFMASFGMAVVGLLLALWRIPGGRIDTCKSPVTLGNVLRDRALWPLNIAIFLLHFILSALFVSLPFVLRDQFGLDEDVQWKTLGAIILLSIPATILLVLRSERSKDLAVAARSATFSIVLIALSMIALTMGSMSAHVGLLAVVIAGAVFFSGFNFLEANLPARVSMAATEERRGTALGVYASSQYLGVFAGGALAGVSVGAIGPHGGFAVSAVASVLWLFVQLSTLPKKSSSLPH